MLVSGVVGLVVGAGGPDKLYAGDLHAAVCEHLLVGAADSGIRTHVAWRIIHGC
jgi:hypothetical protein